MENSRYKFRVWTGKYMDIDVWVNSNGAYGEPYKKHNTPHIEINKYDDDAIVMQFTGLIDKNGKEIYEGDIYNMGDNTITYTVVWNDSGFIGKQNGSSSYAGLEYWMDRIEIIGNVYENKNLIN